MNTTLFFNHFKTSFYERFYPIQVERNELPFPIFSFLFFSFLFFSTHLASQPTSCQYYDGLRFNNNEDLGYQNCFVQKRRFFFHYPNNNTATDPFLVNQLIVSVDLTGGGVFHPVLNQDQYPVGTQNGTVQVNPTNLAFVLYCIPGTTYSVPIGGENAPFFDAYVIVDEGQSATITATATAFFNQPGSSGCQTLCSISGSNAIFNQSASCSTELSSLSAKFASEPGFPLVNGVFTSPNHLEVPVYLELKNNGASTITLSDLDLKLKSHDTYGTLPVIAPTEYEEYFVENTQPEGMPLAETHNGDLHYFHYGSVGNGTLAPGATIRLLAFTVRAPEVLENILGNADIDIDYLRVSDDSGNCCDITGLGCEVVFPGLLPCSGSPAVMFGLKAVDALQLDNCQSAFDIVASVVDAGGNPSSIQLGKLDMVLNTTQSGNLSIFSMNAPTGILSSYDCPPGGGDCEITFFKISPQTPFTLSDGMTFRVVYQGDNGTELLSIDAVTASLRVFGSTNDCVPEFMEESASQFLPQKNTCLYCENASIRLAGSSFPLGDCQKAFAAEALKSVPNTVAGWKSVKAKLTFLNTNNLSVSVVPNSIFNTNTICPVTIPSGATAIANSSNVPIGYIMSGVIYFQFCFSTPANLPNLLPLFDVIGEGTGCLENVQFGMETELELWNNQGPCHPENITSIPNSFCTSCLQISINGVIQNYDGEGMELLAGGAEGIFVQGSGSVAGCMTAPPLPSSPCNFVVSSSCDNGDYSLMTNNFSCPEVDHYTVTPYNNTDPLDGVTTFDLVLISKHILGIIPFQNPYKIIAGDANKSNAVTTADLVMLRKLILFIEESFEPLNTSWRFVASDYAFPNPANPFQEPFSECKDLKFGPSFPPSQAAGFVAIKVGDVNGSAISCLGLAGNEVEGRNLNTVGLAVLPSANKLKKGDGLTVDILLDGPEALAAWQAGLRFDAVRLAFGAVLPTMLEDMDLGNFGLTGADEGKLRMLWFDTRGEEKIFDGKLPVARFQFSAKEDIQDVSSLFHLDETVMPGMAFRANGSAQDLQLKLENATKALQGLAQPPTVKASCSPNPFSGDLKIKVSANEAAFVDVNVFDQLGRMVANWHGYLQPGETEVVFDKTSRWGKGAFTWQVVTDSDILTGKAIKE